MIKREIKEIILSNSKYYRDGQVYAIPQFFLPNLEPGLYSRTYRMFSYL